MDDSLLFRHVFCFFSFRATFMRINVVFFFFFLTDLNGWRVRENGKKKKKKR